MKKEERKKIGIEEIFERRREALRLWKEERLSIQEIADRLGVHRNTISRWLNEKSVKGYSASLFAKSSDERNPSTRKLSIADQLLISKLIAGFPPNEYSLPWSLWCKEAVHAFIKKYFLTDLEDRTLNNYLKRWGFSSERIVVEEISRNDPPLGNWLEKEYESIKDRAKQEGASIYWLRRAEVPLTPKRLSESGEIYGEKPVWVETMPVGIESAPTKIEAINNQGKSYFICLSSCTVKRQMDFIRRLKDVSDRKLSLIFFPRGALDQRTRQELMSDNKIISVDFLQKEPEPTLLFCLGHSFSKKLPELLSRWYEEREEFEESVKHSLSGSFKESLSEAMKFLLDPEFPNEWKYMLLEFLKTKREREESSN